MNAPEPTPTPYRIIVFDLDGTLSRETWPSHHVGEPIEKNVELMLHYASEGFAIKIYTARPESHKKRIWRWLEDLGYAAVILDVVCDKPLACLYVDDKAYRPELEETGEALPEPEPPVRLAADVDEEDPLDWEPNEEEGAGTAPDADDPERWTVMD